MTECGDHGGGEGDEWFLGGAKAADPTFLGSKDLRCLLGPISPFKTSRMLEVRCQRSPNPVVLDPESLRCLVLLPEPEKGRRRVGLLPSLPQPNESSEFILKTSIILKGFLLLKKNKNKKH